MKLEADIPCRQGFILGGREQAARGNAQRGSVEQRGCFHQRNGHLSWGHVGRHVLLSEQQDWCEVSGR